MVGKPGIYYLYRRYPDAQGGEERRLLGKFVIMGLNLQVLEDHDGLVESVFPTGPMSGAVLSRMAQMQGSAYYQLVHDDEVEAGEDDVPEVKIQPDAWE